MKKLIIAFTFLSLFSCGLTDNFSEEPMYLIIDEAKFTPPSGIPNTAFIRDVWVYVDGFNVGVFELPARVPVLGSGTTVEVDVIPGIRDNGLEFSAKEYPFYTRENYVLDFVPSTEVQLDPAFEYLDNVNFAVIENFEVDNLFSLDLDDEDETKIVRSEETPYGSFGGKLCITESTSRFQQTTQQAYPTEIFNSSEVYLEIDYKSEVNFSIGYLGQISTISNSVPVITLFPKEEWSKLYLNLSAQLNGGEFDAYKLYFGGSGLDEEGCLWIDNVRIVYI